MLNAARICPTCSGLLVAFGWTLAVAMLYVPGIGCAGKPSRSGRRIRMATTTSTESSGLLGVLLPSFEEKYGIEVDVIAVGTGKAIAHGENGDVDLIFVHARDAEEEFVREGFGVNRRDVMHNDFVILGPPSDPAGVGGAKGAAEALAKIAKSERTFISRGDESGTHKKERSLWKDAGVEPSGAWYLEAGQGMAPVLTIADEKQAYTISDRGTYVAFRDRISLTVLVEGDDRLFNPYGIIAVNPARHPHVRHREAMKLIEWVTSPEGQRTIGDYRLGGERLFYPGAVK